MRNRYGIEFWIWIVVLMLAMGCSTEYDKGWSWGMVTEDGVETAKIIWTSKNVRVDNPVDVHEVCRKGHYTDPYSKLEYCLPEEFKNMNMIHLYRVK